MRRKNKKMYEFEKNQPWEPTFGMYLHLNFNFLNSQYFLPKFEVVINFYTIKKNITAN